MNPEEVIKQIVKATDRFIKEIENITSEIINSSTISNDGFKVVWSDKAKDKAKK